jgi:hypothetical protein
MKKFLLALIICCNSISIPAQTSVYHLFPDSSASWNFTHSNICWGVFFTDLISMQVSYYIGMDTLINSSIYHSLHLPIYNIYAGPNCWPPGNYTLPGGYMGAFRNDHANKKVYIIPESDSIEQLLYDFDMQVGDTLVGYLSVCSPFSMCDTVISIDSVLVGNSYRKRWHINSSYHIYFIEGIGSTYGLLKFVPTNMADLDDIVLDCFQQNGQNLYPDTLGTCPLLTSVAAHPLDEMIIKIHPNPSKGNVSVELSSTKNIERWVLQNVNGQMERTGGVQNESQFEINGISPGFYLLTFILEDGRKVIRKIVVV